VNQLAALQVHRLVSLVCAQVVFRLSFLQGSLRHSLQQVRRVCLQRYQLQFHQVILHLTRRIHPVATRQHLRLVYRLVYLRLLRLVYRLKYPQGSQHLILQVILQVSRLIFLVVSLL
jgi:hypothetical protein